MPMCKSVALSLLLLGSLNAEVHQGKVLFDSSACLQCHNLSEFSDKNTKVKTFKTLHQRVTACTFVAEEDWFDDDILDVTKYLNEDFYKLEK